MLLLLLIVPVLSSVPLKSVNAYFEYEKVFTTHIDPENSCIEMINKNMIYQKCNITDNFKIQVGYKDPSVYVYVNMMFTNQKPEPRDVYTFTAYNLCWPRIYQIGNHYLVTTDKQPFTDNSVNKTGNFVVISPILGYSF